MIDLTINMNGLNLTKMIYYLLKDHLEQIVILRINICMIYGFSYVKKMTSIIYTCHFKDNK